MDLNDLTTQIIIASVAFIVILLFGIIAAMSKWRKKAKQGQALIKTGGNKIKVSFNAMWVIPVLHRLEIMDISLKSFTLERMGKEGLICKDNLRADIKVTFFIRVEHSEDAVKQVAKNIGAARASDKALLTQLFDAKFSEALKTVGKKSDFEKLYSERDQFKKDMLEAIGEELNGYTLESAAIDYLEQTSLEHLDENNILDSQGIKKITELTAEQKKKTNQIRRDEEKELKRQDVEAQKTILDQERKESDEKAETAKEIAITQARAEAERESIEQEERLKMENARITTEEELQKSELRKQQEIIIMTKANEAIDVQKTEEVKQEQELAATKREQEVELARIAKRKKEEEELRDIQQTIKERIQLQKETVAEEEEAKDIKEFAEAERIKKVALIEAEKKAEEELVQKIKTADANKQAAEIKAEQDKVVATTKREIVDKEAESKKIMADAEAEEAAALGLSEAKIIEAKAEAMQKQGESEATVIRMKAQAEAEGIASREAAENEAYEERGKIDATILEEKGLAESKVMEIKAESLRKQGLAEAEVFAKKGEAETNLLAQKGEAEAGVLAQKGEAEARTIELKAEAESKKISAKAEAMKKLDGVGKEHEEFKLKLEQQTQIELAKIDIQKAIAEAQAGAIGEALKASDIKIIGGETMFYENIMRAITRGEAFESFIDQSDSLKGLKDNLLAGNGGDNNIVETVKSYVSQLGVSSNDVRNLTISALLMKMMNMTQDKGISKTLETLLGNVQNLGIGENKIS